MECTLSTIDKLMASINLNFLLPEMKTITIPSFHGHHIVVKQVVQSIIAVCYYFILFMYLRNITLKDVRICLAQDFALDSMYISTQADQSTILLHAKKNLDIIFRILVLLISKVH